MADSNAAQRMRAATSALATTRRDVALRWHRLRARARRGGGLAVSELAMTPPDLRVADPSFASELADGELGLAGAVVTLAGRSPFAVTPPSGAFARELHGFGWLRHLASAPSIDTERTARDLVDAWLAQSHDPIAWEPDVTGRRVIAWLSHAGLLLDGTDRRTYAAIVDRLAEQAGYLARTWSMAPPGYPRLLALTAAAIAYVCLPDAGRRLGAVERCLFDELGRQISPDGGHASRNAAVLVELMLDILPLRQCLLARREQVPAPLTETLRRMAGMIRHMRLGDGQLARFNGVGTSRKDALATVLALDSGDTPPLADAAQSGYARLERGAAVIIVDVGRAPPAELAGSACAGALALEMSDGTALMFTNAGAPASGEERHAPASRATASHSTLTLGDTSSSRLLSAPTDGPAAIEGPASVAASRTDADGAAGLETSHDGYQSSFGLIHSRRLTLSADGRRLDGEDRLHRPAAAPAAAGAGVPFAIHFHVATDARVRRGDGDSEALIILASNARWRFEAAGAQLSIEDSLRFADGALPRRSFQIVLRGVCAGEAVITWHVAAATERAKTNARPERTSKPTRLSDRLAEVGALSAWPAEETSDA